MGNHLVLLVSTTMLAVTLAVIPFCSVLGWLAAVLAVMGFFMGTIDTVANISMIQLYGMNVAPFLQVGTEGSARRDWRGETARGRVCAMGGEREGKGVSERGGWGGVRR